MATATAARHTEHTSTRPTRLRCRIRLADGRLFAGDLEPERHRALQIGMLHRLTHGLVELAAWVKARGDKHAVSETRFLRVDIDHPGQLHALWAFVAEHPCHLLVASGGSGGVHAYWKLTQSLEATRLDERTGEVSEPIEHSNLRIVHALGVRADGKPNVADPACAERSRVMRLAGTVNAKTAPTPASLRPTSPCLLTRSTFSSGTSPNRP
jgi:hypothetical protein